MTSLESLFNHLKTKAIRQIFDTPQGLRRRGQAAIEYILIVAISVLIFGAVFYAIRQSVFRLWICDITPRVESAGGCNFEDRKCYAEPAENSQAKEICGTIAP